MGRRGGSRARSAGAAVLSASLATAAFGGTAGSIQPGDRGLADAIEATTNEVEPTTSAIKPTTAAESDLEVSPPKPRGTATQIALAHLLTLGEPPDDVGAEGLRAAPSVPRQLAVDTTTRAADTGVTHVYVQQRWEGIDVVDASANVAVGVNGQILHDASRLTDLAVDATTGRPAVDMNPSEAIDPHDAVRVALAELGVEHAGPLDAAGRARGPDRRQQLEPPPAVNGPISVRLVWVPAEDVTRLVWEVRVDVVGGDHAQLLVSAEDATVLRRNSFSAHGLHEHHTGDDTHDLDADDHHHTTHHNHDTDPDHHHTTHHNHDTDHRHTGHHDTEAGRSPGDPSSSGVGVLASPSLTRLADDGSSYRVLALPVEAPSFGPFSLVAEPADALASPFGWHDLDGVDGAESTLTTGNNVDAYLDQDGDDQPDPGGRPDGGSGLDFDVVWDPDTAPDTATNAAAAVINLFHTTNWAHDFFHAHGFDEAAGNFQQNNYGNGGAGGDPLLAETLDSYGLVPVLAGSGQNRNNANFTTPPDGLSPRVQMYGFVDQNPTTEDRPSSLDNGVVLHEYAHGWSTRLTGGRNNVLCLTNDEQMGEGWSDWAALMATIEPGDDGADARSIATWAIFEPPSGQGVRDWRYSTLMSVDPRTYDSITGSRGPWAVGSVWAAMLWDVTWALIDRHGLDADLVRGDGGNNLAMRLVTDGLKLQACRPGFVDARDAIIAADRIATEASNECLLWEAFARRGLGWSASQGSPWDRNDGTEAFDLPPFCPLDVSLETIGPSGPNRIAHGEVATLRIEVVNRGQIVRTGLVHELTTDVALDATSSTCPLTTSGPSHRFTLGDLQPGATARCEIGFSIDAPAGGPGVLLDDSFEVDLGGWTADTAVGSAGWTRTKNTAGSGEWSVVAGTPSQPDGAQRSDQSLVSGELLLPGDRAAALTFSHRIDSEFGYDGGVVELSVDGGPWLDAGDRIESNGYDVIISPSDGSPLAGRPAFSGERRSFESVSLDLSDLAGSRVRIRFRFASDAAVASEGWFVDDVRAGLITGRTFAGSVRDGGGNVLDERDVFVAIVGPPAGCTIACGLEQISGLMPNDLERAERLGAQN